MLPYQLVPSDMKVKISIFPAVAVITGAPSDPHFTLVNVAVPFPVDAACFSSRTKVAAETGLGIVNVQAVEAVSVAV